MDEAAFLKNLVGAVDWGREYAQIDELGRKQDWVALARLYHALLSPPQGIFPGSLDALKSRIVDALALNAGRDNARMALRIVQREPATPRNLPRAFLAAKLAGAQSADTIVSLLSPADLEFSGCLIHEALFAGKLPARAREIVETVAALTAANHPLARLPLELHEIERNPARRMYSLGSTSWSLPFRPRTDAPRGTTVWVVGGGRARELTTEAWAERAAAAFEDWILSSDGRVEARCFALELPTDAADAILRELEMECVRPGEDVFVVEATGSDAFACLYSAAAHGGAYTSGAGAAYGRLDAWRSIAALVGSEDGAELRAVAEKVERAGWGRFESSSKWFHHVAWDVGLLCRRPGGVGEVALLAATDTD